MVVSVCVCVCKKSWLSHVSWSIGFLADWVCTFISTQSHKHVSTGLLLLIRVWMSIGGDWCLVFSWWVIWSQKMWWASVKSPVDCDRIWLEVIYLLFFNHIMFYEEKTQCIWRVGLRAFVASGFTHSPVCRFQLVKESQFPFLSLWRVVFSETREKMLSCHSCCHEAVWGSPKTTY